MKKNVKKINEEFENIFIVQNDPKSPISEAINR